MKEKSTQQKIEEEKLRLLEEERKLKEEERKLKEEERKQYAKKEARGCILGFFWGILELCWVLVSTLFKILSYPFRLIIKIINFFD